VSRPWVIDIETVPLGTVSGGLTGVPSHWMDAVPYQPPEPRKVPASYRDPAKIAAKQRELELRYQHELAADQAEHADKRVRMEGPRPVPVHGGGHRAGHAPGTG